MRTALAGVLLLALFTLPVFGAEEAAAEPVELKPGAVAPEMKGAKWISADGKAPELKGKVYLVDFWFEE